MGYYVHATHFWEFQVTDDDGASTWQRYNLKVQEHLYRQLKKNNQLSSVTFEEYEFIFDYVYSEHCQLDVRTGSKCAMRRADEVIVEAWDDFNSRSDAEKGNITKLHLRQLHHADVLMLMPQLVMCKSLWFLDLGYNNLTDASGVALGKVLGTNATLAVVWMLENNFGEESGVAIGEAMTTNTSLEIMHLSKNDLGEKGGAAIIRGLNNNTTLKQLLLGRNNLGDNIGAVIQNDFTSNASLEALGLQHNPLGDNAGVAIATWLATNTVLKKLNLRHSNLGDVSGVAIAKALTTNTTLQKLFLGSNELGEKAGAALVTALAQNSSLVELDVSHNAGISPANSPATLAKIKFALSPELKGLLTNPSVSPSRVPVCVVGFDNVGKTELVNTWYRTTMHYLPRFDAEERAAAQPDDERDKTSGISIKSFALREKLWSGMSVNIAAWDFAGHAEYYLSHEVMLQACRDAVFIVLLRIDCVDSVTQRNAETERLLYWLKFIATACANQPQSPTVFIGGSFRPANQKYDVDATTEWTDTVLQTAKGEFGDVLNLPQQNIYHMDCRKYKDPHVAELRKELVQAAETNRTQEDRKVPQICESVRTLLQQAKQDITSRLASHVKAMAAQQSNVGTAPLSWQDAEYAPIMSRADFEEGVLGKSAVKTFTFDEFASTKLLQIITSYLHDVGDILWFDTDGLRDIVILTPDLFCSKIIGAILCPNALGFDIDAVHSGGGLVPKKDIAATFKRVLGITDDHVDAVLSVLCQLGLSHQQPTTTDDTLYLFPGALAATSCRQPKWFGPLSSGQHFVVGRRFTLTYPNKTIFNPGCMSQMQVWALGKYEGSLIWCDGVVIPYTATRPLAEAGIKLHRPHSSSLGGDKCASVSVSSITLIVRGVGVIAKDECAWLLDELCDKIRTTSGVSLDEEALPPNDIAHSSANKEFNMLDVTCAGYILPNSRNHGVTGIIIDGRRCSMDDLYGGACVFVPHPYQGTITTPTEWDGEDNAPMSTTNPTGGTHLFVEVQHNTVEFARIQTNMRVSFPHVNISKIERVQNNSLWKKYFITRSDVAQECVDQNPIEIEAWHGTGDTDPRLICGDWKAGFDVARSAIWVDEHRRLQNHGNKVYGVGVYLAKHAIYCDTMRPHECSDGTKQLIFAKVVLGKCYDYGATMPDGIAAIEPVGHHSVSGTEEDMAFLNGWRAQLEPQGAWTNAHQELIDRGSEFGRQYAVRRSERVYPAYLVTYTNNPP